MSAFSRWPSEVTPRCDGAPLPAETVMMLTCAPPHSGLCINRAPPSVSHAGGARCRREETAAVLKEESDEQSSHARRVERHRRGSQVEEELPASAPAMGWSHPAQGSTQSRHLRRVHQVEAVIDLEVHFPQYARELRIGKPVHRRIVRVVNQVAAMFHD